MELLRLEAEASGYVPNTNCVLHDVDEPMKVKLILKGAMMLMLMRLFVCFFVCIVWGVGLSMLMLTLMFKYNSSLHRNNKFEIWKMCSRGCIWIRNGL